MAIMALFWVGVYNVYKKCSRFKCKGLKSDPKMKSSLKDLPCMAYEKMAVHMRPYAFARLTLTL